MNQRTRYWTGICSYDGKREFRFHSSDFVVTADTDMQAHDRLQGAIDKAWATISPHPAPRLLDVIPGALVLERMTAESIAEERREYG